MLMKLNADSSTRAEVMTCTKFFIVFCTSDSSFLIVGTVSH